MEKLFDFEIAVRQMRYYQKLGERELAEKAEKVVDKYIDDKFEPQIKFEY